MCLIQLQQDQIGNLFAYTDHKDDPHPYHYSNNAASLSHSICPLPHLIPIPPWLKVHPNQLFGTLVALIVPGIPGIVISVMSDVTTGWRNET